MHAGWGERCGLGSSQFRERRQAQRRRGYRRCGARGLHDGERGRGLREWAAGAHAGAAIRGLRKP